MKFKSGQRRRALEYEKAIAEYWRDNETFEKSVEMRPETDAYVFYDGPPFISGSPHWGTLLSSIVKDAVPRYWTMKGKRVERVWGWDCHGLPAENFVEQKLGITDKREIGTKISLEDYIIATREAMLQTSDSWENVISRVGRWVDFRGAYKTMDRDFMESVWWAFKKLYDAGKIYEGAKVLMYDTKFATPVSKNEVTMDNDAYQAVTDPSVFVKFKINPAKDSLKFTPNLTKQIQNGQKWSTYRLDSKNLEIGDTVDLITRHNATEIAHFAYGKIKKVETKKLRDIAIDAPGHETYDTKQQLEDYQNYYGKNITLDTKITIYEFDPLADVVEKYILAWTTTPWTLPANMALAVNPEMLYVEIKLNNEILIVAKSLLEKVLTDEKNQPIAEYEILREFRGAELVGKSYEPLFARETLSGFYKNYYKYDEKNAHKIWPAEFVSDADGTGIVHIAPAYGEDDFELARANEIPLAEVLDENGCYLDLMKEQLEKIGVRPNENNQIQVWEANKFIAKILHENTRQVWKIEYIQHEYPFNPRSKERIMYRAVPSWFFDITTQKPLMLAQNENVNWFPSHFRRGRFAKNIEQAPDWNLSRNRFWATALPVWKGDKGSVKVVGSYAELRELSGVELEDYHRPWVDEITFTIDGEKFTRVPEVLDCWFESGSMPFAQFHYPFENAQKFEANFPGDFISEYVPQIRAWFYYVHVVNTALAERGAFGEGCQNRAEKNAFKNVIVTGTLAGNDGFKMSKSRHNYTDPEELMDKFSADAVRFLILGSPLLNGEDFALKDKDVSDVARKLAMIWNMYDFFTMYAEVDGWEFDESQPVAIDLKELQNPLDVWIVSRVHELTVHITKYMDEYNLPDAISAILPFVDDASNWFVRRSRRRFWKSDDDADKDDAYKTLHYALVRLAVIMAPFTPFLAEELYRKLTGGESVHLLDWPTEIEVDEQVLEKMAQTREIIEKGLAFRMNRDDEFGQIKVRKPLAELTYMSDKRLDDFYEKIIKDEVNVKECSWTWAVHDVDYDNDGRIIEGKENRIVFLDKSLTPELKREGLSREVIRFVQKARKDAGLNVDDRIILELKTDDAELQKAIDEWREVVAAETLADFGETAENIFDVSIEGENLQIALAKK